MRKIFIYLVCTFVFLGLAANVAKYLYVNAFFDGKVLSLDLKPIVNSQAKRLNGKLTITGIKNKKRLFSFKILVTEEAYKFDPTTMHVDLNLGDLVNVDNFKLYVTFTSVEGYRFRRVLKIQKGKL